MVKINRFVKVNTSFRGIHNWPECPFDEVAFLRVPHRHTFHVSVQLEVSHQDREIEFFRLQMDVDAALKELYGDEPIRELGRRSCEQIAEELFETLGTMFKGRYSGRPAVIEVSEDNEVSAVLEFTYE